MRTARPPAKATAAKKAVPPRGNADAAPVVGTPVPNPDETVTVTVQGIGTQWLVYSSKTAHRICVRERDKDERQVVEYPWDEWRAAANYVVACVNKEYQKVGSAPSDAPTYCGCGERTTRDSDGRARCPIHGRLG